jgi:hypothetical protein
MNESLSDVSLAAAEAHVLLSVCVVRLSPDSALSLDATQDDRAMSL